MKLICVLVVTLLGISACGGRQTSGPQYPIGLETDRIINIAGLQRTYHLFVPENPVTAQMIFLLHGNRGSSDQILGLDRTVAPHKLWLDIAERENLILVVPNGETGSEGHQGWNDCRSDAPTNPTSDDVLFINTLMDSLIDEFQRVDNKVFFVGTSNGGLMSMRLADELPDRIHAFAAIVASRPVNSQCSESSVPISALIMNGTEDPILPYEGGHIVPMRGELLSTVDAVAYWVNRNQANTVIESVDLPDLDANDSSFVRVFSYRDGIGSTQVKHMEVVGGGHTEPSIAERFSEIYKRIVGEQNNDIEMAEEVWSFFSSP